MTLYTPAQTQEHSSIESGLHAETSHASSAVSANVPTLSGDYTEDLFTRAQIIMNDLKSVMEQETAALRTANLHGALEMQDRKIQLMQRYEQLVEQAKNHEQALKASTSPRKAELKAMEKDFKATAAQNKVALKNGKKSLERLVDRMLTTIRQCVQQQDRLAYTASGAIDNNTKRTMSINLDQTL